MNRQDLEREFESTILAAISQSPCPECGGDIFTIQHHVKATAMYLAEIVKSLKLEEGKFRTELPFEEVKKRADKKTAKFFRELSTQELERVLGTPGLPTESEEPSSQDSSALEPSAPLSPTQEPSSQTDCRSTGPSHEPPHSQSQPSTPEEETVPPSLPV